MTEIDFLKRKMLGEKNMSPRNMAQGFLSRRSLIPTCLALTIFLFLMASQAVVPSQVAEAAGIGVNTPVDDATVDGNCTLRDASPRPIPIRW